MHVCAASCVCLVARGGQKRVLDSLELELQMVMSHHVSAENPIKALCKAPRALNQ